MTDLSFFNMMKKALIGKTIVVSNPETKTLVTSAGDVISITPYWQLGNRASKAYVSSQAGVTGIGEIDAVWFVDDDSQRVSRLFVSTDRFPRLALASTSTVSLNGIKQVTEWLNPINVTWGYLILEDALKEANNG